MQQKVFKQNIFRYIKIWLLCLKASLKRGRVYKSEIVVRILRTLFILLTQLLMLSIVYGNQEYLAGWSRSEAYLVLGIWNVMNYMGWAFFGINLLALERRVLEGDFDFVLLKPISSAWLVSFGEFSSHSAISAFSGMVLIGYYFVTNWAIISWGNVAIGFVACLVGFMIWYAMYLLFASFTISVPRNGFLSIAKEILALTRYPTSIYTGVLQLVFYSVIPIAFVAVVPANFIIGREHIVLLFLGLCLAIAFLRLSLWMWKVNVRKYTSAGG